MVRVLAGKICVILVPLPLPPPATATATTTTTTTTTTTWQAYLLVKCSRLTRP